MGVYTQNTHNTRVGKVDGAGFCLYTLNTHNTPVGKVGVVVRAFVYTHKIHIIHVWPLSLHLYTDACGKGWGCVVVSYLPLGWSGAYKIK